MDIKKTLEQHKKWLQNKEGGVRADFNYANLGGVILSRADLRRTNLIGTILIRADLRHTDLRHTNLYRTNLTHADLRGANLDFSQLNLSCDGLDFIIDERIAKQITYHLLNLMQTSDLDTNKIFKKSVYNWVNSSHLIYEHGLDEIEEK